MDIMLKNKEPTNAEITSHGEIHSPEQFFQSIGLPKTIPVATAMDQLLGGFIPVTPGNMDKIRMLVNFVASMKPKSMLEAQLIVQMIYCHRESVKMFQRADKNLYPEGAEKYQNMGVKLLRAFRMGLESLGKYRRDGKQSFYIERVTVEKDAQAVIGNVGKGGMI
jgi:hypothetical protein